MQEWDSWYSEPKHFLLHIICLDNRYVFSSNMNGVPSHAEA